MNYIYLYFIYICLCSCQNKEEVQKLSMEGVNPINYCFNNNKEEVKEAINYLFSDYRHDGMGLYKFGDTTGESAVDSLLLLPSNIDSRFIVPFGPIGNSKVYLASNGDSLKYFIDCYEIEIDSIGAGRTDVSIITHGANIIYAYECLPSLPNFNRKAKYKSVEPSSIEEYEILLKIGKFLRTKEMPDITYPQ